MSLKWGALALAILDSLIQIFAAFYLHFAEYKALAYFGLIMAVYDLIVIFSFPCQRKVFPFVLQLWQVLIFLYGGYLVSQWFFDPLIARVDRYISEENPCYEKVVPWDLERQKVSTAMAFQEFTSNNNVEVEMLTTTTEWDECLDFLDGKNVRIKEGLKLLYVTLMPFYYSATFILLNALRGEMNNGAF